MNAQAIALGCPFTQSAEATHFDPFGSEFQRNPPDSLRWSRDGEPVFYSPAIGYWIVSRYDDVKAVFRDNRTFSPSIALEKMVAPTNEVNDVLQSYDYGMARTLVNEDEPAHTARRRLLIEPFTPAALREHEPMVRHLVGDYIDRFANAGRVDLVDAMLWEVPLTVALHFLGIPEEDMDAMRQFSIAHTVNTWGRPKPEEQLAVAHAVGQFWQYAGAVLEKMRANPDTSGWMPYGIRAQRDHADTVTDSYLHSMMMAGIVAAHETTAHAAANALRLLLENPAVWQELCQDPALIPNAVEECLRHSGSVVAWRRIVTTETTLHGVALPAGARLLIVSSSGNHDERHFDHSDEVDIYRENASDHLTFGYGSHQCMGKNLARMELQIILEEFIRRLPHMRLVPGQEFTYLPNVSFRGPDHLWVEWDPALNPSPARDAARPQLRLGEPSSRKVQRRLAVQAIVREADGVVRLALADPTGRPLSPWSAGAHIDLDCGGQSRQYSLCGRPEAEGYEVAVRFEPNGRGGSRFVHEQLRVGDIVRARGPRNHFRLDATADHSILIAGGIGITPILAMADELRATGSSYEIHYAGRSRASMPFLDRLRVDHGARLAVYASDDGTRLHLQGLLAQPRPGTAVYACGPQRMIDGLQRASAHWPKETLHIEHFASTLTALDPAKEHAFDVRLAETGVTITVGADETVLQALRAANVDVDSDCEEGLCGACQLPVLSGEIDHRDMVLSAGERASNRAMMACCSRACSDRIVLQA